MSIPLAARACSEIAPAAVRWLWEPFLARGKIAVLDGAPGTGKSFFTVDLAARLSRGGPLPDGRALDRPHVTLLVSAEDDPFDTVRPRAAAAGADLAHVFVAPRPGAPVPQFPECAKELEALVYAHAADLVVLDPLAAFLPARAGGYRAARDALAPLAALAAETGCAVLLVRHRTDPGPGAAFRGGGIGAFGSARTGLLLAPHPDDPDLRVLALSKSNLGPPTAALGFRLDSGASGGVLRWTGPVDLSADELCGARAALVARRPRERAAEFLRAALASGPCAVSELERLASEKGLSWKTVKRAKDAAGFKAELVRAGESDQRWQWFDPQQRAAESAVKDAELRDAERKLFGGYRRRRALLHEE